MNEFDFLSMVYYNEVVVKEDRLDELRRLVDQYGLDWVLLRYPNLSASDIQEITRGRYL